jgi:hypothetical protein
VVRLRTAIPIKKEKGKISPWEKHRRNCWTIVAYNNEDLAAIWAVFQRLKSKKTE